MNLHSQSGSAKPLTWCHGFAIYLIPRPKRKKIPWPTPPFTLKVGGAFVDCFLSPVYLHLTRRLTGIDVVNAGRRELIELQEYASPSYLMNEIESEATFSSLLDYVLREEAPVYARKHAFRFLIVVMKEPTR